MKYKIIIGCLFLLLGTQLFSQGKIDNKTVEVLNKRAIAYNLLQDDADFKNTNTNDAQWSDESTIILSQKTTFSFDKEGTSAGKIIGRNIMGLLLAPLTMGSSIAYANTRNTSQIMIMEKERRKILLRDNYAVDQFSIIYFRLQNEDAFAGRVIKKNGAVQVINLADAIDETNDESVPSVYTCYTDPPNGSSSVQNYFKIPIENLEPGDIIEYEMQHYNEQSFYKNVTYKEFEPIYYSCTREFPVAKQAIEIIAENDNYYLSHKSMKGAADFTNEMRGSNKVFRWTDNLYRPKSSSISYVNPYREMPAVKFQVLYASNKSKEYLWFDSEDEMKKDLTVEKLASQAKVFWFDPEKLGAFNSYISDGEAKSIAEELYKKLKKYEVTKAEADEYVQKSYYYIRAFTASDSWSDYKFAKVFSALLKEKKIEHDIIVTPYNTRTNISNLAFSKELAWAIKYNDKFYINPETHINPSEVPIYLAGNICVSFPSNNEKAAFTIDTLSAYTANQNKLMENMKATLEPVGKSDLTLESAISASGQVKDNIIDEVLAYNPYFEKDYMNYDGEDLMALINEKMIEEFNTTKKTWRDKDKPEYMKSRVEQNLPFEVEKYDLFQLVNDGRSFKKRNLEYKEKYTLSHVTSIAGNDLLISLSSLIGSQAQIDKKEQVERVYAIDVKNARNLNWHIEMPIPTGYTAAGFENITYNIDNKCASFISTAKTEGGKIIIDAAKTYKTAKMAAADWPLLLEMLNAAYNFSQSKIVLQKLP